MGKFESYSAEGVLQVVLFIVLWFKWSVEKHCVVKVLLAVWEILLRKKNCKYNFYRFRYKFTFILFLSFLPNQNQESSFQQVGGLLTNEKYFAKYINILRIFLHVIPVQNYISMLKHYSLNVYERLKIDTTP